ncbi:putative leucine-rich repeat-containing protein DDB_G0290503 [Ceratina calcarata]|uniref:Leucine-rich repeat-containing protein DDB_G0290503 n=1 Tax=Ceratina calcarata TaxID=156304 RepID=A0AAJ7IYP4_9HYME|nr:putative leucine-rich repeat-containing protein DDB_G0290503 [Ceratina calcarata]
MGDERHDNSLSVEVSDETAYKEKTRIAEVAASTLCRLNSLKKQMRDWRDDRMKLRSNIWRLKLALRVAERETDDTVHADPLVEQQRAEIKRLESVNKELKKEIADVKAVLLNSSGYVAFEVDDKLVGVKQQYLVERERLNNEIRYLKSRLNETVEGHEHGSEVEHLECKLKHFMMVDHTMEIIFTDIVNKVVETIANLSEELVNVNERLHRTRLRNDGLYVEIDGLKAMLRFKNGNPADYQKRIVELENLTKRMKGELNKFKMHYGDGSWTQSDTNCQENLKAVVQVGNELKHKLRNDRDALLAAGDPDCLKYMQKIIELRVGLRQLHVELVKLSDGRTPSIQENDFKQLSILDWTMQEITGEIDRLKSNHLRKHCRIGDIEGLEYLSKIEELEAIVEKARATMNGLNRRAEGGSNEWKDIEKLEGFVGRMCYEIKQLEVIVTSSDRSDTFKRIEQLEELIGRLKTELNEKDERVDILEQKLFDKENLLEERMNELENAQRKITTLMEENRGLKGRVKKTEEKMSELLNEHERSKKDLEQLQQVKREASAARKGLQNLQTDKEGLLKEMGKIRDTLQKKNEEIKDVLSQKDTVEKVLNARITELTKNLQAAEKENEKMQSKVNALEGVKCKEPGNVNAEREIENARLLQEATNSNVQLQREIADLKSKLEFRTDDNKRLEANNVHLESKMEMLLCQLCAERNNTEERSQEFAKLKSDYNDSEAERASLKQEKEQLSAKLTTLKLENELLEKSVKQAQAKCVALNNEIDKYKFERDSLREEIQNFRTSEKNLTNKLKETEAVLNGTGDRIRRLEFENSKLYDDLNALTIKNTGFEGRVQILLSQKNENETLMKNLNDENSTLRDQLNEIKTTHEYCSVESNKLRVERDKMKSENDVLQTTLDEVKQSNRMLKGANEDLKLKLSEIHSECRILGNQLKILEMMNATLKKEKELLEQEFVNSLEFKTRRVDEEESMVCSDSKFSEQNVQGKIVNETKSSKHTKSGKHTSKTKKSDELKKLKVENESLRFEVLNLKSQNIETKAQLSRMMDKLQIPKVTEDNGSGITVKPLSNKLEIVNLYYKEIKSYSDHSPENAGAVTAVGPSTVCAYSSLIPEKDTGMEMERLIDIMKKLKVENVALKMEVNSLRCSLVVHFTEDEKRRNELRTTTEEIQALKAELTKLRDERESLWFRLHTTGAKLDRLESEKTALKDELYTLRKINSELKYKANVLEQDYQKLKEKSVGFEGGIVRAIKRIKKYTIGAENQDNTSDDLKFLLKKYISNEEVLRSLEKGIDLQGR